MVKTSSMENELIDSDVEKQRLLASYLYIISKGAEKLGYNNPFPGRSLSGKGPVFRVTHEDIEKSMRVILRYAVYVLAQLGGWKKKMYVVNGRFKEIDIFSEELWIEKKISDNIVRALDYILLEISFPSRRVSSNKVKNDIITDYSYIDDMVNIYYLFSNHFSLSMKAESPTAVDRIISFLASLTLNSGEDENYYSSRTEPSVFSLVHPGNNGLIALYKPELSSGTIETILDESFCPVFFAVGQKLSLRLANQDICVFPWDNERDYKRAIRIKTDLVKKLIDRCVEKKYYRTFNFVLDAFNEIYKMVSRGKMIENLDNLGSGKSIAVKMHIRESFCNFLSQFKRIEEIYSSVLSISPVERTADEKYLIFLARDFNIIEKTEIIEEEIRRITGEVG